MKFRYRAMNGNGQNIADTIEAADERQARLEIRSQGLFLQEIRPLRVRKLFSRPPKISTSELTVFTRQLATLCSAALPLEESLAVIARQTDNKSVSAMIHEVRKAVLEGHPLSDALAQFPATFDSLYRTLIKAGEKSGLLAAVMERLADYIEVRQQTRARLMQSLIYPLILTTVAFIVVIILLTSVVPKVAEQFVHMKQQLPLSTRILLGTTDVLHRAGPAICILVVLASASFVLWLRRGNHRHHFHARLLRVAIISRLIKAFFSSRYLRTLSILQTSGIPLLEGMILATEGISNLEVQQRLSQAAENVRQGNPLHASLENTTLFPPMMLYMVASGEKSGQLGTMMTRAADNQESLLQHRISLALAVFEPLLIVTMAMVVLFIVVSVLQPILQLNSMVN
jgi:general secretion pathway protein F